MYKQRFQQKLPGFSVNCLRKSAWLAIGLLTFASACSQKKVYPQKSEIKTTYSRLYFEYRNCDWRDLQYLGYADRQSYTPIQPATLPDDIAKKYLLVKLLNSSGTELTTAYTQNPQIVESTDKRYSIATCETSFFVDVPLTVPLAQVASINVGDFVTLNQSFAEPVYQTNLKLDEKKADRSIATAGP